MTQAPRRKRSYLMIPADPDLKATFKAAATAAYGVPVATWARMVLRKEARKVLGRPS